MNSQIKPLRNRRFPLPDRLARLVSWRRSSLAAATAWQMLIIGLGLALFFSITVSGIARHQETRRLVENISGLVSTVEATARVACFTQDKVLAAEVAKGLLANRTVASVRITSGTTVLAEAHKHADADEGQPEARGTIVSRRMASPFNEAEVVGEIELVSDDAYIGELASNYSSLIVIASLVEMLLIAFAVGWVVLRTITTPIRQLSSALKHMDVDSGGHVMAPAGQEYNEVGHLTYVFNNLIARSFFLLKNEQELRLQLTHNESRFRALAENSPNLIVRYNTNLQRIYCNPAYYDKLGVTAENTLNKTPEQMWRISNSTSTEYQTVLRSVLESGLPTHVMLEWSGPDGALRSNDFHLVPERDATGQATGLLAIGHDISALKRQQRLDMERSLVFERMVRGGALHDVLAMVAEHVESSLTSGRCAILLQEEQGRCLRVAAAPNLPEAYCAAVSRFALGFPGNGDAHSYWTGFGTLAARHGLRVGGHEVILDSADHLLGMLVWYQECSISLENIDANFLRQACSLAALAIERKHIEDMVQHHASYDALTDLPNRRMFGDRLREEITRADRTDGSVTLLFIDLDRFKGVNDTLGHEVGDLLLVKAAGRIRTSVRASDIVARLGGDEFVVAVPDVDDLSHLGRVAKTIVDVLCQPFEVGGHTVYVSASVGIASYPSDADSADKLVSCADQAMYAAKEVGRSCFRFYSAELSISANERLALELDLRQGIARGELELYFQPKIYLINGSLVGSEALLRWNHPQRGLVPPGKFIGIAEDSGLIEELGEWVLQAACRVASEWNAHGRPLHKVAINLSARQFQSGDLYQKLCAILEETQCLPEWIELEITESLLLEEGGDVLATLNNFRRMGISIAIDDFGTGYSALSYLARFPINTLKIDRSFINNITRGGYHAELVKAIISIARCLNQQVVAEGVETQEQADFLRELGCQVVQGYLYGKPLPKLAFEELQLSYASEALAG
jgi:diguanylate cyclase (GGDEF)-like protein/PAS domain S-box-containing protein